MSLWMSLVLLLIVGALVLWVLLPLRQSDRPVPPEPSTESTPSVPDGLDDPWKVQQLIDLEYDYQTGKVSYEEYVRQKREILGS